MDSSVKQRQYSKLLSRRKVCRVCRGLINPADYKGGVYDSNHIGPWSRWQGNLDAPLMIVGQDWGTPRYFGDNRGFDDPDFPTNKRLRELLESIGISIGLPSQKEGRGKVFLTNAILCLKQRKSTQAAVKEQWFKNCQGFLRDLVEIVKPKVLVTLGQEAFRAILSSYGWPDRPSQIHRDDVERRHGVVLPGDISLFAVYHCGNRILNTHRDLQQQRGDWRRIGRALKVPRD